MIFILFFTFYFQQYFVCDYDMNVDCQSAHLYYNLNNNFGQTSGGDISKLSDNNQAEGFREVPNDETEELMDSLEDSVLENKANLEVPKLSGSGFSDKLDDEIEELLDSNEDQDGFQPENANLEQEDLDLAPLIDIRNAEDPLEPQQSVLHQQTVRKQQSVLHQQTVPNKQAVLKQQTIPKQQTVLGKHNLLDDSLNKFPEQNRRVDLAQNKDKELINSHFRPKKEVIQVSDQKNTEADQNEDLKEQTVTQNQNTEATVGVQSSASLQNLKEEQEKNEETFLSFTPTAIERIEGLGGFANNPTTGKDGLVQRLPASIQSGQGEVKGEWIVKQIRRPDKNTVTNIVRFKPNRQATDVNNKQGLQSTKDVKQGEENTKEVTKDKGWELESVVDSLDFVPVETRLNTRRAPRLGQVKSKITTQPFISGRAVFRDTAPQFY